VALYGRRGLRANEVIERRRLFTACARPRTRENPAQCPFPEAKRTSHSDRAAAASGPKADMPNESWNVCFWVNSGHRLDLAKCPLMTRCGSQAPDFAVTHKIAALHQRCGRLLSSA
jgi:hypothetical protein